MLKREVTYEDVVEVTDKQTGDKTFEEKEVERKLRFVYTVKTMKLYENRTGRNFFDDYHRAFNVMSSYLFESGLSFKDVSNISEEESIKLLPMLTDPLINHFLADFIPCFYAQIQNGALVQNEETIEDAENSMWFTQLINVEFFMAVFDEISSKNFTKQQSPKGKKNTSKKS